MYQLIIICVYFCLIVGTLKYFLLHIRQSSGQDYDKVDFLIEWGIMCNENFHFGSGRVILGGRFVD